MATQPHHYQRNRRTRSTNGLLPTPVFDRTDGLFHTIAQNNTSLSANRNVHVRNPTEAWQCIKRRMLLNLNSSINMPSTSIAKCALFPNESTYARDLQLLFEQLERQKQDSFHEFLDQFSSESIQQRLWSAAISPEVQNSISHSLKDVIRTLSLLVVLSVCQGVSPCVTYLLGGINLSRWEENLTAEYLLQSLAAQHIDLSKFMLNIHHSLENWPLFITRFSSYFKELLIPPSVGEFHVKMILIRETTIHLSQFFNFHIQTEPIVGRPSDLRPKTARRMCPRCTHGWILLSKRTPYIPDPSETAVCDLTAENIPSTLFPDEDQAADFTLVLANHGLTPQHLAHFSHECPLSRPDKFTEHYNISLDQVLAFRAKILKLMRKNKTCIKCGKSYTGARYPPQPEHVSCNFWDSETSSISVQSRFASTAATNIKPHAAS